MAIAIVVAIIIIIATVAGGNSMSGIKIVEEQLITEPYYTMIGNNLYPIVVVKVKNTSNKPKKVSFEVNFYADGKLLGDGLSEHITLAPGDEAFIHAQSDKGYRAWSSHDYSYKITKWYVFS
ncbi:MAG: FxLYD domain-containing protein [Acutalibacteraceae bacterium]